jgi:hypothetical protein
MPALAPVRPWPVSTALDLPSISFFGRSLAEYSRFFALALAALRDHGVLDVAAGPASFTAEACARRINAVAVDPLDGCTPGALAAHVQIDYARMFAQIRHCPQLFWVGSPSLARLRRELRRTGLASEVVPVDFEFFAGGHSMLVLTERP